MRDMLVESCCHSGAVLLIAYLKRIVRQLVVAIMYGDVVMVQGGIFSQTQSIRNRV